MITIASPYSKKADMTGNKKSFFLITFIPAYELMDKKVCKYVKRSSFWLLLCFTVVK